MPDRQATAMLDCEDGETEANSNCTHCQASGDTQQQRYWDIQLDQDLLETICSIYPEWFKDCNMNLGPENNNNSSADIKSSKQEETNQKTIDKNKESLKVKLMLRRPFNQLVDQGIIPSLKSSPSFHESRQKLERAKMGDILKHKIQKRPDRKELIQQHILEDSCNDSSLQDQQRQLKRARLADGLNERLSQKSSGLELVKVNILHADEILAQAVREGGLSFSSCDTPSPQLRLGPDEDSGSDGTFSPSPPYDCNEHSQGSLPSLDANESSPNPNQGSPCSAGAFSMSPPSSASSPLSILPTQSAQEQIIDYIVHFQNSKESTPSKNRKKTKPKTQPKARTIKFHEYKGPPNAQKNNSSVTSTAATEPSYDLLLQQQQLQLQWQLEWLHKNPQPVLHTPQKRTGDQITQVSQKAIPNNQTQQIYDAPASPQKLLSKLEDMKVSDLKTELKKRNLPVSGSKPLLIERLKSYSEIPPASNTASSNNVSSSQQLTVNQFLDNLSTIPTDVATVSGNISSVEGGLDTIKSLLNSVSSNSRPPSAISLDIENTNGLDIADVVSDSSSTSFSNEDIVQLQQRFIEKLQRELERSQLQLQQSKQSILSHSSPISTVSSSTSINTKTPVHTLISECTSTTNTIVPSTANSSTNSDHSEAENKAIQRQVIHQQLLQKIQNQQQRLLQEAQKKQANATHCSSSESPTTNSNSTLTALLESRPMNASPVDLGMVTETVTSFASSVNDRDCNRTNSISMNDYTGVITIENSTENRRRDDMEDNDFPGVIPIESVTETSDIEAQFDVVSPLMVNMNDQADNEPTVMTSPNTISSRSSSLPSFSALVSCKPSPTRSNTDPHFTITRPPPDYNEATRQLSKVKQQLKSDEVPSRQNKVHKSSLKSQVVDDVLEILIKNGELPPSAAQEPSNPISKTEQAPVPIFTNTNDVFFSKPMTTTSLMSTTMAQTSVTKDGISHSPDLHMSLQSVLELTPPSSAGFGDTGSAPTSSLDFDFSLDMSEIEGMDLETLENPHTSSHSDISLSSTAVKDTKSCVDYLPNSTVNSSSHIAKTEMNDRGTDRSMDMDLIEWLEVLEETSATSSASRNFHHPSSYGITNDHDPLFSASAHETLDLFATDDIDFKPQSDLNFLPWGDKTDFTT